MTLIELQNFVEEQGIEIDYFDCGTDGLAFYCGDYHIALQSNLTAKKEKLVLAEEFGHCATGSFYFLSNCCNPFKKMNIAKCERKARDYAASLLIPLERLILYKNCPIYEIAEEFDKTCRNTSQNYLISKFFA